MSLATVAVRREARWLVLHWGARTLSKRYARKGMPLERMLFEPGSRADPYPLYEEIRARGRVVKSGAIAHATVDYAVVSGALRDASSFSVNFGESAETPRAVRWLFRPPDPNVASVVEAPALLGVDPPAHTRYRASSDD